MEELKGFIYIRNHPSYEKEEACKMGKAMNIPERDTQYATSEIKRGYFEAVFEVALKQMGIIERLLQYQFQEFNVKYDAGTEFYHKKIIDRIEPYLISIGVPFKKLTKEEIQTLVRPNRVKLTMKKINRHALIQVLKKSKQNNSNLYTPRTYQQIIIDKSVSYFQTNDKGILVLICGVGKTLISLWITQRMNATSTLIGVPNHLLLKQWEKMIANLFPRAPCLKVCSGVEIITITKFFENNPEQCFVLTTYASAHKVYKATQHKNFVFSMKINDEAHHLTTTNMKLENTEKKYIQMLNIVSVKHLSLTATLKQIETEDDTNVVVSNNSIHHFGEIIERKSLNWAISENVLCDYVIQTIVSNGKEFEKQVSFFPKNEEHEKRLFLSAFASLKSIMFGHSHHLLIYSNNKENSLKIKNYIKLLFDQNYFDLSLSDFFYSEYHSEMKPDLQKEILNSFGRAKFGIISCVYCLGEGWDCPLLDGVVFSENMSSTIRIVQSALRASRKNKEDLHKITKIILPILNKDEDWFENSGNPDLKKVKEVIYRLGLEDETISQKIKVFRTHDTTPTTEKKSNDKEENIKEFGEYDEELSHKFLLKTIKRTELSITYEKAKNLIAFKNIKSKEDYYELCDRDYRFPINPEIVFKGKFTNWVDYLSIERVYFDIETCKRKVREYLLFYPDLKKYSLDFSMISRELCKRDPLFPPSSLWVEYYNVKDLKDIITFPVNKRKLNLLL